MKTSFVDTSPATASRPDRCTPTGGGDGRGPSLYVKDPEGNTVELKGPPTQPYDPNVGFIP